MVCISYNLKLEVFLSSNIPSLPPLPSAHQKVLACASLPSPLLSDAYCTYWSCVSGPSALLYTVHPPPHGAFTAALWTLSPFPHCPSVGCLWFL
jgi:hypothetical protein